MSRYTDVDALKKTIDKEIFRHDTIDHVFQIIDNAPSIDIVRCRECKKRDDDFVCYKWASIDECPQVRPDDFCSYGEREGE